MAEAGRRVVGKELRPLRPQGVCVISPRGKLLGRVPIPEDYLTNLAFGGPDRKTLYVLAGTSVYTFPVTVSGYAVYPRLGR